MELQLSINQTHLPCGDSVLLPLDIVLEDQSQLHLQNTSRYQQPKFIDSSQREIQLEQQYFHMDNIDENGQKKKSWLKFDSLTNDLLTDRSNNEYNFVFDYKVYLDYTLYHVLFFLLLGPFSIPIITYMKGWHIIKNMHFHNISWSYFQQLFFWLMYLTSMTIYFYQKQTGIYITEIILLCVSVFLRIIIISCKYATLPQSEIALHLVKTFTNDEILSRCYVHAWQNQTNYIIHSQVHKCMKRNEFDEQLFFVQENYDQQMQFIQSPSVEMLNQISICDEVFRSANLNPRVPFQPVSFLSLVMKNAVLENENHPIVSCYGILKYLLDYYQLKYELKRKSVITFVFIFSFVKSLLPIYFRYVEDQPILGKSNYDAVAIIFIAILQLLYYFGYQTFIVYGIYDLYRLVILQVQMCYLIMPKKQHQQYEFSCVKHFPTLNIFNALNMNAWIIMRKVFLEYGRDFFLRIQMLYSVTFVYILIFSFITIFEVVGVFRIDQIFGRIVFLELIQLCIEILIVVYLCARINEFFQIHQDLICENKEQVQDLYSLRWDYFSERKIINNKVHKIGVDYLQNLCNGDQDLIKTVENILQIQHLKQLIDCYDDIQLYLKTQSQTQPFTIVGFKVDKTFLKSVFAGFVSIIGSLVQLNSQQSIKKK